MIYIKHRINKASELASLSKEWGVEIDLRSDVNSPGSIHLSHDAWSRGDAFEAWADSYKKLNFTGPLILNTKEDGLEEQALKILQARNITNYFFLDTQIPTLVRRLQTSPMPFAVRISKYEADHLLKAFSKEISWIWLDCFETKPFLDFQKLSLPKGVRVCLVSPELQGGSAKDFDEFEPLLKSIHAISTKMPEEWERRLN